MPRRKTNQSIEKQTVTVNIRVEPYFAAKSDDPKLAGQYGIGPTPELAVTNFRSVIYRVYPFDRYEVEEVGL